MTRASTPPPPDPRPRHAGLTPLQRARLAHLQTRQDNLDQVTPSRAKQELDRRLAAELRRERRRHLAARVIIWGTGWLLVLALIALALVLLEPRRPASGAFRDPIGTPAGSQGGR